MDRSQQIQQHIDDHSDSSSSSSSSSIQPIDDPNGCILVKDYVGHDGEVIINKSS